MELNDECSGRGKIRRKTICVETDTADEINQFAAPPPASTYGKKKKISLYHDIWAVVVLKENQYCDERLF